MNFTITKAVVATVDFGFVQVEGLMLPDGTYAIAAVQANNVLKFSTISNNVARDLKLLLGKDSTTINKVKTELNSRQAYVLTISQFKQLIRELDKRGNKIANAFVDATLEESIERRFDTAFSKRVDEYERNELLSLRMKRLLARHDWTDTLRDRHQELYGIKPTPDQYREWTVKANQVIFLRRHFNCDRDNMTVDEQRTIEHFEAMCVRKSRNILKQPPMKF